PRWTSSRSGKVDCSKVVGTREFLEKRSCAYCSDEHAARERRTRYGYRLKCPRRGSIRMEAELSPTNRMELCRQGRTVVGGFKVEVQHGVQCLVPRSASASRRCSL